MLGARGKQSTFLTAGGLAELPDNIYGRKQIAENEEIFSPSDFIRTLDATMFLDFLLYELCSSPAARVTC
eukprot:5136282-Pyramimonas_sp.AAC.1